MRGADGLTAALLFITHFKEQAKREPVQSFWTFTVEMGVGIHARDKGKINSWGDLAGEDFFTGPRPWDTRAQLERALGVLGGDVITSITAIWSTWSRLSIDQRSARFLFSSPKPVFSRNVPKVKSAT